MDVLIVWDNETCLYIYKTLFYVIFLSITGLRWSETSSSPRIFYKYPYNVILKHNILYGNINTLLVLKLDLTTPKKPLASDNHELPKYVE